MTVVVNVVGLQEYVEALSFLYYIEQHSLLSLQEVEANLTFSEV